MNRGTVNMVRSPISVEGNIRLVPYYPAYDTDLRGIRMHSSANR